MAKDAVATMGAILPDDVLPASRDAVHVAVISAVAGNPLEPGEHVGFGRGVSETGEQIAIGEPKTMLGIVDPYIKGTVKTGQRFWLYLYPRTITGLSHRWSHPDIPDPAPESVSSGLYSPPSQKLASENWLRAFCASADCPSYETVLGAAARVADGYEGNGWGADYLHFNDQDAHGDIPPEFWDHVAVVIGRPVKGMRPKHFSCSC